MTWPFDDDSALPLHDGIDVGGAQDRQMAAVVGGYGGIRTVEERNPDGSITTLRTRGGNPIFETVTARQTAAPTDTVRGFVAKASSRAVLFDPYTLDVLNANYSPALNTYAIQHFATAWNVPALDDTHWHDVVLFDGATIKVNAKVMPALGITANHGFPAIPYVINRATAEDQYGNAERNVTEKRVFAVGRSDVKAWGGGGVVETLTPTAPRSEGRSMTIGQRVDRATNKAWIGQIYHPAAGWDAAGEWAFTSAEVTMLLTAPYLSKAPSSANVALTVAEFGPPVSSSGSSSVSTPMPDTEISIVGVPEFGSVITGYSIGVIWPFREKNIGPLNGATNTTYSKTTYSGSSSASAVAAGRTLTAVENNVAEFYDNTDALVVSGTVDLPPTASANNSLQSLLGATGTNPSTDTFFWYEPSGPNGHRGDDTMIVDTQTVGTVSSVTSIQNVSFSVSVGGINLVSGQAYRKKEGGNKTIPIGTSTRLDGFIANPYGWLGVETGLGSFMTIAIIGDATANSLSVAKGSTEQEFGILKSKADQWMAVKYYPGGALVGASWYTSTTGTRSADTSTMSWSSKDYLLYDETNGVFISVDATFSGVSTAASLDVILKVQTRFHTTTQVLGHFDYTYSQLVVEREIGSTGKYAMPSPQIRAIFAPLYQEQGSFKGAHYVTQLEESNGATPAHLFNFLLRLRPYSGVGTVNDDNLSSRDVHFVPCNLLEMLYAFVFSQEYGVAASGERYPVTFTARYNDMMATLFSIPVRVAIRDGAQGVWSDAFGPDFASISTVSLHRA